MLGTKNHYFAMIEFVKIISHYIIRLICNVPYHHWKLSFDMLQCLPHFFFTEFTGATVSTFKFLASEIQIEN